MKWSIRTKFLIVMSGLLALCLSVYLFMAITVFKTDKTQLVFDLNRSQVANLISQIETQFMGVSEKLKLFTLMPNDLQSRMVDDLFSEGSEIVSVAVFKSESNQPVRSFYHQKFLDTYGLDKDFFTHLTTERPIPFAGILRHGQDVWNASGSHGPPLIGYGRLVVVQDKSGHLVEQWAVVGFIKLDRILKLVGSVRLGSVVVANRRGEVLVHPDAANLLNHPSILEDKLFQEALNTKAKLSLADRELDGHRVLAAFAHGFDDQIVVIAKSNESEVFQVVTDFTARTLLFGSIVLTLVILAAFLLSRSLTENIALLVDRMESVSRGDLTSAIRLKGRDETVTLANTFNQMIHDLHESRSQLETMNHELDEKVKERTTQLEEQNKKVKEVQEALIRTTRMASMGEIAGRTAHEVLNPLTILLTRVGLMQKRVQTSRQQQLSLLDDIRQAWKKDFEEGGFEKLVTNWRAPSQIQPQQNLFQEDIGNLEHVAKELQTQSSNMDNDILFVKNEGERIGKIVNAMRRLGHLNSEAKAISLHSVLNDCCQIMSDLFEQKGFVISKEFHAENHVCVVDRDEMVQSLTNLMRNSLQALEDAVSAGDSAAREMKLRTSTEPGFLFIEIEDNGIGIPAENQKRLFESSFTTKPSDQGTGLGLGISRRFVRGYGGDIEFVSSVSKIKTVFRIRLPLSAEHEIKGAVA